VGLRLLRVSTVTKILLQLMTVLWSLCLRHCCSKRRFLLVVTYFSTSHIVRSFCSSINITHWITPVRSRKFLRFFPLVSFCHFAHRNSSRVTCLGPCSPTRKPNVFVFPSTSFGARGLIFYVSFFIISFYSRILCHCTELLVISVRVYFGCFNFFVYLFCLLIRLFTVSEILTKFSLVKFSDLGMV